MKRRSSEQVNHTYGLRSSGKRLRPMVQSNSNVDHQFDSRSKKYFPLKYPVVVLHDIRLELEKLQKSTPTIPYSYFMKLNDHCILELFEFLPLTVLCTMAQVSMRLKQLAEYFFRLKYARDFSMKLLMHGEERIGIKQARCFFETFGHLITSLHVSRKWFVFDLPKRNAFAGQRQLLSLITNFAKNLTTLTLADFWIGPEMIMESFPIFTRIQTLNYYRLSCYCSELKTFCHFALLLTHLLEVNGLAHQMPQLIQLV